MIKRLIVPLLLLPVPLAADISDEANACIDALIERGDDVGGEVLEQSDSEAGTLVRLRDATGAEYECVVWSGPEVAELRRVSGEGALADDGGGAMDGAAGGAEASIPTVSGDQRVQFDAGASGAVMSATLQAGTSVRYLIGAEDGQLLNVSVGSHGGALDYRIHNPDGSALLDLVSSDTPYRGQLWQSGDHVVEVVNAGAQPVAFDIGIGID